MRSLGPSFLVVLGILSSAACLSGEPSTGLKIVSADFVFEQGPVPECHASTLVEVDGRLLVAWFAGTEEGEKDVVIWLSRQQDVGWSKPQQVADGVQPDGSQFPCWNPVLFRMKDEVLLFYKVGPSPSRWWGMLKRSADAGQTWSAAERLPEGILGPIKNKPALLADGTLLCGSSTEHDGWRVHMESTRDGGKTWTKTGPLNDGREFGAIQPAILLPGGDRVQILCRSRQKQILASHSTDNGRTWAPLAPIDLPNPNSGIDAVTLKDGRHVLIYNHTDKGRSPLNVALSRDGKNWEPGPVLETEPGEYSYPAVIQSADGRVHVSYTWKRQRIRHVVLQP